MKLPKQVLIKDTLKLFNNKYPYKVVIVTPTAQLFRNKNYRYAKSILDKQNKPYYPKYNAEDKEYAYKLIDLFESFSDEEFDLRIESPLINVYTSNKKYVELLTNLDETCIKYISIPNKNHPPLEKGKIIVKRIDYKYKIFLGITKTNNIAFLNWAENNSKIKITNKCKKDLSKNFSWGGSYFYVMDEKLLVMVKMFLSDSISRIESVIKA